MNSGEDKIQGDTARLRVVAFRQKVFVGSETFIPNQMTSIVDTDVKFLTRRRVTRGETFHGDVFSLEESERRFHSALLAMTGRSAFFVRTLLRERPDIVHAHFGPDGALIDQSAHRAGVPLVVSLHGRDATVTRRSLIRTLRPVALRYALARAAYMRRVAVFIAVSDHLRTAALEAGFPADKVVRHYIGVDTERFAPGQSTRNGRLVHIARLVEKKGTSDLIRAVALVKESDPDVQLDIVGDGPLRPGLEAEAAELGLTSNVHFLGHQPPDRVLSILKEASAFVLPSRTARDGDREGLPISILEAMSCATPVISTYHSGIPEAITDGEQGLLVPEASVTLLSLAIAKLREDVGLAARMGRSGRTRALETFDLVTQGRELRDIYSAAVLRYQPSRRSKAKK